MLVSSLSLFNNYGLNKLKAVSKSNTQSKSQVAFSAKRLPSGDYSDWFFDLVKKNLSLSEEAFRKFAIENSDMASNNRSSQRKYDFLNLRSDLKNLKKVEDIHSQKYDAPTGEYSSKDDYDLPEVMTEEEEKEYDRLCRQEQASW